MISGRESRWETRSRKDGASAQHDRLHGELVGEFEQKAIEENHGLIYLLVGWQHLLACLVSNYLLEYVPLESPHRWPYLLPWVAWVAAALLTVRLVRTPSDTEPSPLAAVVLRVWLMFFLLCGNAVGLNLITGLPLFIFLPVLATLSTFAWSVMTALVSRRFLSASILMFVTGLACASLPAAGFLLYGIAWLIVLHTLGLDLMHKRRRWLTAEQERAQVIPFSRLNPKE